MAWLAALGPVMGNVIGSGASAGDREKAERDRQKALDEYNRISAPSIGDQWLNLDQETSAGNYNPDLEQTINQGDSGVKDISIDPRLQQAQFQALQQLQGISDQGGLNLSDKAQLNDVLNQTNQQSKSNRDAIVQHQAERGRGGSGFDLAAQLAGSQSDSNNAATQGLNVAAQAQERALQALMGSGNMATNMRDQSFGEQSATAKAQDAINQFNARNAQTVTGQNTNRTNDARQYNLGNAQRISDQNVGIRNTQQASNKGLYQQEFGNKMELAGAKAGQYNTNAKASDAEAARTARNYQSMGNSIGGMGAAAGMGGASPMQGNFAVDPNDPTKRRANY